MIVKPTVSFLSTDGDARLATNIEVIISSMTGNANYPAPTPPLAVVQAAKEAFINALSAAADGGKTLTARKNDRRAALVVLVRQLANYVATACNGDLTVLISSGFPIHKPQRQPVGVPAIPSGLTLDFGVRTGELDAVAAPVPEASIYNWRLTTAAAPEVLLQTAQSTGASWTFTNLTPGVIYRVTVNAVATAGASDWSNPATCMAV